jgi:hypothetical protein
LIKNFEAEEKLKKGRLLSIELWKYSLLQDIERIEAA